MPNQYSRPINPAKPAPRRNLTHQRFFFLVAIEPTGFGDASGHIWKCRCDCGNTINVSAGDLTRRRKQHCGCRPRGLTHGASRTKLYRRWMSMIVRCRDENHPSYFRYGGRGITVSDAWLTFEGFYADMGEPPTPAYTIERVDNNKGYSKDNCIWATRATQSRNLRNNRLITLDGRAMIIKDWSVESGIRDATIRNRLRYGWPIRDAIFTKSVPHLHRNNPNRNT